MGALDGGDPADVPVGFAVLLAPFVRVFGLDYGRLKLVEVACFCAWLVLYHGIVRRRTGRVVAMVVTAVFATAPVYLVTPTSCSPSSRTCSPLPS